MAIASVITCTCKPLSSPPPPTSSHFPTHRLSSPKHLSFSDSPVSRFSGELSFRRSGRATTVVTRAGPSSSTFAFAFFFPLSLLAVTVFAAWRIGDRLDQKFLEEVAIDQAIREMDDDDDEDEDEKGDMFIPREKEPALPRTRSRPKREV